MFLIKFIIFFIFFISSLYAENLKKCEWDNRKGIPCIVVSKTPNTSEYSESSVNKIVISKEEIDNIGAIDVNDVLKLVSGLDVFQSGNKGQSTSIFTRGSESNHTLVMINGIAINDQSVTDGLHDFGQDFVQSIQQIEIYKGASGAIFGPAAIGGAINFVTDINYQNSISLSGSNSRTNSISGNYTYLSKNGWHHNIQAGSSQIEELSTQNTSKDLDGTKNLSLNYNSIKFLSDNTKLKFICIFSAPSYSDPSAIALPVSLMFEELFRFKCQPLSKILV